MGLVLAQVAGSGSAVTSHAVIELGGMFQAFGSLSAELIKLLLPIKMLLMVFFTSPLNRKPRHGGYSLFSISTIPLLLSHDFDTLLPSCASLIGS